jgi:hypothetical protein
MALSLRQATPAQGVQWMRDAFALFMRRPLAFGMMFVSFLVVALLATLLPLLGGVLLLMSLPLLGLGFMLASRSARAGGPVHPGQFIEPLRAERSRRNALLTLCALYALCTAVIMSLSEWIDGGTFERLQQLMAKGDEARAEIEKILADPRLGQGLITRFGLAAGQGVAQALFSSTLSLWRCKGAFLMYSLAWVVVIALFGAIAALAFSLFDAREMAGLVAMPAGLMFSTVFYVSLLFTYEGCFSTNDAVPPQSLPQ